MTPILFIQMFSGLSRECIKDTVFMPIVLFLCSHCEEVMMVYDYLVATTVSNQTLLLRRGQIAATMDKNDDGSEKYNLQSEGIIWTYQQIATRIVNSQVIEQRTTLPRKEYLVFNITLFLRIILIKISFA